MLDQFKFKKSIPLFASEIYKKKYSVSIPNADSNHNQINLHYEKVSDLVNGFDQRNLTDYDQYLINDVLGTPNANHNYSRHENGD